MSAAPTTEPSRLARRTCPLITGMPVWNVMTRRIAVAAVAVAALAASSAQASGSLSGKYQTKIPSGQLKGTVTLGFVKKGTYTVKLKFGTITGSDTISGSTVTLSKEKGGSSCKGPGKYKFKITGKTLKFTKISDACKDRAGVLAHTFTKVG